MQAAYLISDKNLDEPAENGTIVFLESEVHSNNNNIVANGGGGGGGSSPDLEDLKQKNKKLSDEKISLLEQNRW